MTDMRKENTALTTAERQFAALYFCGDNISTASMIRDALSDIYCPDDRAAADALIRKLEFMDSGEFAALFDEEFRHD